MQAETALEERAGPALTCLWTFHEETWISRAAPNLRLSSQAFSLLLGIAGYGCQIQSDLRCLA